MNSNYFMNFFDIKFEKSIIIINLFKVIIMFDEESYFIIDLFFRASQEKLIIILNFIKR